MCGIAGICNYKGNPIRDISAMNDAMLHRGPDAGAHWLDEKGRVVLGHRRLSIVDLSDTGAQPMVSEDGRYVITYNGEVYNYRQLRNRLIQDYAGQGEVLTFQGASDTEVLLKAIACYGIKDTLQYIKGMFAFAVYDRQEKVMVLARDRMGEKPLYYGMVQGSFVFSSELGAIRQIESFKGEINAEVLGLYFKYGYIPQPYSIYRGIYKLGGGEYLEIKTPFEEWRIKKYWDIKEAAKRGQTNLFAGTEEEAANQLEKLLREAIADQMMADVPLGAFLSGGVDSTLIVSLMQALSDKKIRTYTVGFEEKGYNEAVFAKETARHLGTEHTEMYANFADVMEVLTHIPEAYTEPFADSSQIPTMLVSKLTRQHVTVSLSGDAGDELFCGYNTYKDMEKGLQIIKNKAGFLKGGLRRGIGKGCKALSTAYTPLLYKTGNCFLTETAEDYYRSLRKTDCRIPYLSKEKIRLLCNNDTYEDGFLDSARSNLMLMDMLQYLPDDILTKVDRASMYYSLESRIPLLDRDVIEFAWQLSESYKFSGGITKKPMRTILYQYVPKEMMERPKKGFSIPVQQWLAFGEMRDWAEALRSDARSVAGEFINLKLADGMWKDFLEKGQWNPAIWYTLMLEQWLLFNRQGK